MPLPSDYTPMRRHILQAVMLAVLGLVIALAAALTHARNLVRWVPLSSHVYSVGDVSVRLPAGWAIRLGDPTDPRIIAEATSSAAQSVRAIWIYRQALDVPISPLQYLDEAFGISPADDSSQLQTSIRSAAPLGPAQGVIVAREYLIGSRRNPELQKDVYAVAVLPSLEAFVVRLGGQGPVDASDEALVKKIAAKISVSGDIAAQPSEPAVTLAEGIQIDAPPGFAAVPQADPNRTDRLLWPLPNSRAAKPGEADWAAIELVSCHFPIIPASDKSRLAIASNELTTLLLVRDPRWRGAAISADSTGWRAIRSDESSDDAFPARAEMLSDPTGRALLVIFHGGHGHDSFDPLWKQLSASVKFLPASDTSHLEQAGAAETARLRRDEYPSALKQRDERWYLRSDGSEHPYRGWSHIEFDPHALAADMESRRVNDDGTIRKTTVSWLSSADAANFQSETTRAILLAGSGKEIESFHQGLILRNGQLSILLRSPAVSGKIALPAPPQYVPGPLLELLMGRLSDGPMLLRTDSFLDVQAIAAPGLLGIIIRPGENSSRIADGEGRPMRCVTAEVNGSGRISRWYFRNSGELESIELPGGATIAPSDETPIRVDFKGTPMAP